MCSQKPLYFPHSCTSTLQTGSRTVISKLMQPKTSCFILRSVSEFPHIATCWQLHQPTNWQEINKTKERQRLTFNTLSSEAEFEKEDFWSEHDMMRAPSSWRRGAHELFSIRRWGSLSHERYSVKHWCSAFGPKTIKYPITTRLPEQLSLWSS